VEEAREHSAVSAAARRAALRRGLRLHVLVALLATMVLIVVNFLTTPGYPWWMWVAVAWGAPLAVHVAIAMELFGSRG
jgi:Flp pilus assembly protein TadB